MLLFDRYVLIALLRGAAPVVLLLLGLFGFLELAEQLEDIGKGSYTTNDALSVAGLHLPRILIDLLPVTCLLGSIIGYGALASAQELTVFRTSGWSVPRIALPVIVLAMIIATGVILAQQWLIPRLEQEASSLRVKTFSSSTREDAAYWTRQGDRLLRIGGVEMGMVPVDIEIYELGPSGLIRTLQQAKRADVLGARNWVLRDVTTLHFEPGGVRTSHVDVLPFVPDFNAEQIFTLINADHALAPLDLIRYVEHLRANGLESHRYEVLLWQQLSLPIGLVALSLLGLPVVMGSMRTMSLGARIAIGAAIGLGFYLVERLAMQLALLYHLPAPATGMLPDLVMLVIALLLLNRRH